jgi:ferritin-like metal-binding protein YciE
MKLNTLKDLFQHELEDLYSAEQQMLRALPRLTQAATHDGLKAAFRAHLIETQMHALRLHKIAYKLDQPLEYRHCRGMESLIEDTVDLIREEADENVRDAALIGAAQRIEHYEIAAYGSATALASRLGLQEAAALLQDTLDEERITDARLTGIAETGVNGDAAIALDA